MRLARYRQLVQLPGMFPVFMWSVAGRLAGSMISLGLVLHVVQSGRSYALAGAVTAGFAVSAGLTAPLLARLVDHRGQTAILAPTAVATLAASGLFSALPHGSPALETIGAAVLIGAAWPPLGGSTSALLRSLSPDELTRQSAFALDASLSEASSIVGPLLVVLIAGIADASAAIVGAGALIFVGAVGLATTKPSRDARGSGHPVTTRRGHNRRTFSPGVVLLVGTVSLMFVGFGATEVAVIAAARHASGTTTTGGLLAVWSVGSVLGGVIYGARSWRRTIDVRLALSLAASAALTGLMIPLHNPVVLALALFASGTNCAPALSMIYAALSDVATAGTITEAFAWLASSTTLGSAVGSTIAGIMITRYGVGHAFAVATIGLALAASLVVYGRSAIAEPGPESDLVGA